MISDALGSAPVTRRETVFRGAVWEVEEHEFTLGGDVMVRDLIAHPGAVAVLATNDADEVLLVHQYRHPVAGTLWELPAGLLDVAGEDPLAAAKRELLEETDTTAATWRVLLDISTSGGSSAEMIRTYLATGLVDAGTVHERTGEEAHMEVRWVPFEEVLAAVLARRVHNAVLVASVLAYDAARRRGVEFAEADEPFDWHLPSR